MSGSTLRQDAAEAFERATRYHRQLREVYEYFLPFRQTVNEIDAGRGGPSEGASITDKIFDSTGVAAAFNFAGRVQSDWMPLGQPFFKLEAGPLMPRDDGTAAYQKGLDTITAAAEAVLHARTPAVVHEGCFDLFAGTMALYIGKGDNDTILEPMAVPAIELALEDGPDGSVHHIWWKRRWRLRDLPAKWPNGKFGDRLSRAIKEKPRDWCTVCQYTYFDATEKRWRLEVWCEEHGTGNDDTFHSESFRTNPWIITRFFKLPGESYGRGLAHIGLPSAKTLNKTRELALTAAAFAVMGIFTMRNDGVFNPETAVFSPLSFWPVGYNGGPFGPSIQRLPVPQDFDVTSIVMKDERDQMKMVLLDDELPEQEAAVRSATEVAGRLRRFSRRWGGVNARLGLEWIVPMVRRTVDTLDDLGTVRRILPAMKPGSRLQIDQLLTKVSIVAPAMSANKAYKVEQATSYLQIIGMLLGPQAVSALSKIDELIPEMGRWMAVEERFIPSKTDLAEIKDKLRAAMAAEQQAAQPAPKPAELAQQYVNGRGMM